MASIKPLRYYWRRNEWEIMLGLCLTGVSALLYLLHYLVFRDMHFIWVYLLEGLAFLPISAFIVTIFIDRLISRREKQALLHKMNMAIGVFLSEVGDKLLDLFSNFDLNAAGLEAALVVKGSWRRPDYAAAKARLKSHQYRIQARGEGLDELKRFLMERRNFLLRLLENPNLLEHESFTELLWAVFHLAEELRNRADVRALPEADYAHLAGDTKRVYVLLLSEWLSYMRHLQESYPYLFSLAVRTNPFDPRARAEVVQG